MTINHEKKMERVAVRKTTLTFGTPQGGEIALYKSEDGTVELDVRLDKETIWLSLNQLSELFERDKSVISRHLRNVFRDGELEKKSTVAFFATVQKEGQREVVRNIECYNLDVIISVGYRVNSKRGTQFRIWATQVLRSHILKGYTINEQRLSELNLTVRLAAKIARRKVLSGDEANALLKVISDYSFALELLDDYDHARLQAPLATVAQVEPILPEEARKIIINLRDRFGAGSLFGREKDHSLESSLMTVFQSVGGRDAYPGVENKAVQLLYFLVKNHPFVDGNKRIAASLFLWLLEKNNALLDQDGKRRLADETLVAITVLIAESAPTERETVTRLTLCILHGATEDMD